jgi:hypothetical protein
VARNRLTAAAGAVAFLALVHVAAPDPVRREAWTLLIALPLGYGHLIAASLAARESRAARGRARPIAKAWAALAVLALFAAYTRALQAPEFAVVVMLPLLVVSAWHIVENDLALARAYRSGLELPALRGSALEIAWIAAVTLGLGGVALTTPSGRQASLLTFGWMLPGVRGPTLADLAAGVLLYHALSFLVFGLDRARLLGARRRARRHRILLLCHAAPALANALLYFWMDALHAIVATPALYLFWSVLHAVETAARRQR